MAQGVSQRTEEALQKCVQMDEAHGNQRAALKRVLATVEDLKPQWRGAYQGMYLKQTMDLEGRCVSIQNRVDEMVKTGKTQIMQKAASDEG